MQLNARIKHKRDTASNWATKNPTPLDGEIIIVETTDGNTKVKVGDGSTAYNNLPFMNEDLTIQVSENTSNISTLTNTKVTGVTSATSGNVVVFDGTGGRLIKDSGKSLADYLLNEEILEATKRVSDVEVNQSVATVEALQTAVARLEANQSSAKHNVGEEWHSYTGKIPEGGVPYCGQEVTRVTYADLWAYAQAQGLVKSESEWQSIASAQGGNVPFYSSGNGSTTFRMPRIVGYMKGASSQSESGAYVKEGLPNITSKSTSYTQLNVWTGGDVQTIGAIKGTNTGYQPNSGTYGKFLTLDFDASRSNAIYGNSDHVTPESSVVLFGVYAFGIVVNASELDASTLSGEIASIKTLYLPLSGGTMTGTITSSVQNALKRNDTTSELRIHGATNLTDGGTLVLYGKDSNIAAGGVLLRATDGTQTADLQLLPNGTLNWSGKPISLNVFPNFSAKVSVTMPYTAPSKGWFIAHAVNTTTTINVNGVTVAQGNWYSGEWSGNLNCQILVDKGDVIDGASGTMRFIPCKSA